jgi:hypothetical protein
MTKTSTRKHSEYRLRGGGQVPTRPVGIETIMASPRFAQGVDDVLAGRGFPPDYDKWSHDDKLWAYERGRMWGRLTPHRIVLKRNGKVTTEAIRWYRKIGDVIP